MKFNEAIDKFVLLHESEDWNEETKRYYQGKIPNIRKCLGDIEVTEIDKYSIAEFTTQQRERNPDVSNRTLNYYRNIVVRILKDICEINIPIKKLNQTKRVIRDLDYDVTDLILNYIYEHRNKNSNYKTYYKYYFMIRLMIDCGARINEVINMKVSNIDVNDCSIFLDVTKYDKERYVFFNKSLVPIYLKYLNRYEITGPYVFPDNEGIGHLKRNSVIRFLIRLQKQLGLKKSISSHKFRHTFASRFIKNGGTLPILQGLLGHEDPETTQIYVHLNKSDLKEHYDKVMKNSKN